MNFQKIAQQQTHWHDPRARQNPRETPLTTWVYLRPYFLVAMCLSACGALCDFLALVWVSPTTVGLMGCVSVLVNRCVSAVLLYESISRYEFALFVVVFVGCCVAIASDNAAPPGRSVGAAPGDGGPNVYIGHLGNRMFAQVSLQHHSQPMVQARLSSGGLGHRRVTNGVRGQIHRVVLFQSCVLASCALSNEYSVYIGVVGAHQVVE